MPCRLIVHCWKRASASALSTKSETVQNVNRFSPPPPEGSENVEGDGRGRSSHAADIQLPLLRAVEALHRGKRQRKVSTN